MSDSEAADPRTTRPSVFLSYASEDREAARVVRDALPSHGLEVWYDESELGGGEAWDQKIRRQIRECDYFMPVVSAQTNRRTEGYFRREWRLAVERTLDMADDHLFLLPIVIDDTDQFTARVPEKFLSVQWLRVPGGRPTPSFDAMCRRLAAGATTNADAAPKASAASEGVRGARPAAPEFPVAHEGQQVRFWVDVTGWFLRTAWAHFKRLPRWIRVVAYVWICIALVSRCDNSPSRHADATLSPADVAKLKTISKKYAGAKDKSDVVKLGAEIAKQFADDAEVGPTDEPASGAAVHSPLLAVAFTAPAGDASAARIADSAFAMAYGRMALAHRGLVGLTKDPQSAQTLAAAVALAKAAQSKYVLFGDVAGAGTARQLHVTIARVTDSSEIWSRSYPASADPATVAADIEAHVPSLDAG